MRHALAPHLLVALLGLGVAGLPPPAAAQGEAERSVDLMVQDLVLDLKRGSKVVVRPFAFAHTGLPDSAADRIEPLILGALRVRIQRDMEVTLVTGKDVEEVFGSLEESAFGGDPKRLLRSVLRSIRADSVVACEPFDVGAGRSHFDIRCRVSYARLVCPGGGEVDSCPEVAVEDIVNQGEGTARIPYRSGHEYLDHVFSDLALRLARDAELGGREPLEVVRKSDDSNRNAHFETFVSSFLHEKVTRAGRERLGLRAIGDDGGRRLSLVWSAFPFDDSYWLAVTLREEGAGAPIVLNARVAVAAIPESMRLSDTGIADVGRPETETDTGDRERPSTSPVGGRAILVVETEPPGASVIVGGERLGETPLDRSDLRSGSWSVVLDHPWHETVRLDGQVLEDSRVLRIERRLVRASGAATVLLEERVPGAWAEHGAKRRVIPDTLDGLPVGPVVLTLGAPGHHEMRVEVEVPKEGVAMVRRRLEPIRHGTLTVTTVPADALVMVEGAGPYRPGMSLPHGSYRLRVSREGYRAAELEVEVSGESSLRVELEPERYPFTVVATPSEAEVRFVDAAERYRPGMELPPARYRVRVSAEGWRTREETVVHGRAPTRRAVRLERLPPPAEEGEAALGLTTAQRKLVQHGLASLGIEVGLIDGLFGPGTREAIRSYQRMKGLPETGRLTAELRDALVALGEDRRSDDEAFAEARRLNTPASYRVYLDRGGRHEAEARALLAEVSRPRWEEGKKFRDCEDCPELVVVPSGSYEMGSPSWEEGRYDTEGPVHRVVISEPFAVGVYEVTFREWDACRGAGGCSHSPDDPGWGRGDHPVIDVSWEDAKAYVRWLSVETGAEYRLLSESEWEYAARGGMDTSRYWGRSESGQCKHANGADRSAKAVYDDWLVAACDDGHVHTSPAGSFRANRYGLYDVLGNVWEWVEDCWHDSYRGAPSDGRAWTTGGDCARRVLRGGSWYLKPWSLRSANRGWDESGLRDILVGFRVARTLD